MKFFALVDENPYEANVLVGIFTNKDKLDKAYVEYGQGSLHSFEVDSDVDNISNDKNTGYCVFSHSEMFGQVAHNLRFVSSYATSAIQNAKRLHAAELINEKWESEWLYEVVTIDMVRFKNDEDVYINDVDYTWKNK